MFIKRNISDQLQELVQQFHVLTLLGPRQAGKTELSRKIFPTHKYLNLENLETRNLALSDTNAFFRQNAGSLILDEIQRAPELLSQIQVLVDKNKIKGQFILTGSHQTALAGAISQSLAGRTAILNLLPLSIKELSKDFESPNYEEFIYRGFMPQLWAEENIRVDVYYRSYLQTYVERDVRQMINVRDQLKFDTFLRLCAGRIGNLVNAASLANDTGVDTKTIQHWLSILEASFIIKRLPPYYENIGKRLVKTPKLYFIEPGLAAYLLGIKSLEQVQTHPSRGALFENMVIMEFIKTFENMAIEPNLYFYRDQNGVEVDLIINKDNKLIPIEIKSSETFHNEFSKTIKLFQKYSKRSIRGAIIYAGEAKLDTDEFSIFNFKDCSEIISTHL